MAGMTPQGWQPKTLAQIVQSLQTNLAANLQALDPAGEPVDVSPTSVNGQYIGAFAQECADLWESGTDLYANMYPNTAEGVCQEQACELVGVFALGPTASTVTLSVTGNEGAPVPIGFAAKNAGGQFQTQEMATITASSADRVQIQVGAVSISQQFSVTINGIVFTVTAAAPTSISVQELLVAAINGGSLVATALATASDITGATFDVFAIGQPISVAIGAGMTVTQRAAQIPAQATQPGPIDTTAGTVTSIVTPVAGVTAVTNRYAGVVGQLSDTPASLDARRRTAVRGVGSGSSAAIAARLPGLAPGVISCMIYENRTDSTDGSGRPAHSYECVVIGGSDQAVAAGILALGPMGIPTYGNTAVTVSDAAGNPQVINFSRPSTLYFWVNVAIGSYDPTSAFPSDGASEIQTAVAALGAQIKAGGLVVVQALASAAFTVPGMASITVTIATSATAAGPPGAFSGSNVQLTAEQQASFDPSRVSVQL